MSLNLFKTIEKMFAENRNPDLCTDELWQRFGTRYAMLVMDSSGFTRITQKYGILGFLSRVVQMRQVAKLCLEKNGVAFFKFEADNVLAYFDRPSQAIQAALDIQQGICNHAILLPDGAPFRVCSGVGFGDVLYSETNECCFGNEMNLASKLGEDVAEPDEVLITQSCYDALSEEMQQNFHRLEIEVSKADIIYYSNHRS